MSNEDLVRKIADAINTIDPLGLVDLEIEESKNEYIPEAKLIVEKISPGVDILQLKKSVIEIFMNQLEDSSKLREYEKIAEVLRAERLLRRRRNP